MACLQYLAPQFITEGRLFWLRSPLYIIKNGKNEQYYFTDEEFNNRGKVSGEVQRNKGLGALSPSQARASMFSSEFQRLEPIIPSDDSIALLEELMSKDGDYRKDFVFNKIDFSKVRE